MDSNRFKSKAPVLTIGEKMAGAEIIEIVKLYPMSPSKNRYIVRFECCGDVREMNYTSLKERKNKGRVICAKCSRKAHSGPKSELPRQDPIEFVLDNSGHPWPKLGRLGHRWNQKGA